MWRGTPFVLFEIAACRIAYLRCLFPAPRFRDRLTLIGLLEYTRFFGLNISMGIGKIDRYPLPAFVTLDLIAATV